MIWESLYPILGSIRPHGLEAGGSRKSRPTMEFLASYEDYFANSEASAASTSRAKILAESGEALTPTQLTEAAGRARNFDKLTVFNRVGGVLVGRKADDGPLRWIDGLSLRREDAPGGRIVLVVGDISGHELRLGPFSADVVFRALLFAADGRPLVVTIINTGLDSVQKKLVHPALLDTVIGCEMIELDSFVFNYISKDIRDANDAEMQRARGYDALYVLASLHGVHALVQFQLKADVETQISEFIEQRSPQVLQSALTDSLVFSDPTRSPLAAQYRIYSPPVLDAMKRCLPPRVESLDEFGQCIERRAFDTSISAVSGSQAKLWFARPKPLGFVSGVPERPFSLDQDLAFLSNPHPLAFLIQDTDAGGNPDVWTFESLAPSIEEGIKSLVQANLRAASILASAEDFTVLQRLFRLIFDGQLRGSALLRQVEDLATQLGSQVDDAVQTSRWNASENPPGVQEASAIATFYEGLDGAATSNPSKLPEVAAALGIVANCAQAVKSHERIASAAAWQNFCSLDKVREALETSCNAAGAAGKKSLVCQLANVAAFSATTFAEIKLTELLEIPINYTPQPTTPRVCRGGF